MNELNFWKMLTVVSLFIGWMNVVFGITCTIIYNNPLFIINIVIGLNLWYNCHSSLKIIKDIKNKGKVW